MKTKQKHKPLSREEALKDRSSMNAPFAFRMEKNGVETRRIFHPEKGVQVIEKEKKDAD